MNAKVLWFLSSARRGQDEYASRTDLANLTIANLRALFPYPAHDPLTYDSYEVTAKEQNSLEALTGRALDMERFDYWIECESSE